MVKEKVKDGQDEEILFDLYRTSDKINVEKKLVLVRSRIQSKLQYTGQASGKLYEWGGAGQVVSVLEEDVPELLAKRLGRKGCCGNSENKIFELVQEA